MLRYENDGFAEDLDHFFSMSVAGLNAEEAEFLDAPLTEEFDPTEDSVDDVINFFAFCRVVVTRGLVVPLERRHGKLLPEQAHVISRDYLALGVD